MILKQGQSAVAWMTYPSTATINNYRVGKNDGNDSAAGAGSLGGTLNSNFTVRVTLAAGDTDVLGPITILLLNAGGDVLSVWNGVVLTDYPSTGDPLAVAVPGAYAAGTLGKKAGDSLDATISSRLPTASYTDPATALGLIVTALNSLTTNLTNGTQYSIALTSVEFAALVAAVWQTANQIETGFTAKDAMRLILSSLAGKVAISGNTVTIRDVNDTKDRIVATTDSAGQRTGVAYDVS